MPRARATASAPSSVQPLSEDREHLQSASRISTASRSGLSSAPSSVSSEKADGEFDDQPGAGGVATPTDREGSTGPAYNTRSTKRAHNDNPEHSATLRRSKRHAGRCGTSPTVQSGPRHSPDISLPLGKLDDEPAPLPTRVSTPDISAPAGKILSLRGRKVIDDEESDSSSALSSPPASIASEGTNRSSTHTTISTQNVQECFGISSKEKDTQSCYPVINDLKEHLGEFPIGEIAYGQILPMEPSPLITVKGVGPIRLPLSGEQLVAIRNRAHEPFEGKFGSDWPFNSAHRLTPIINDDGFELENTSKWDLCISSIVSDVGAYLGFGSRAMEIRALPRSLCLWEKGDIWRGYTKPHLEHKQDWIGTMLLILDHNCQGGEIAARYRSKDILFEHAAHGRFMIASHAGTWLDVMPLTEGYRLGLTYELYLCDNPVRDKFLDILVEANRKSELALARDLNTWVSQIDQGQIMGFPLLQVLDGEYEQHHMNIYSVNAEDRTLVLAAAKATRNKQITPQRGYTLGAYFVLAKGTSKNYSTGCRVRYSIEWAATIEGQPRPDVKTVLVDEKGVLQKDKFVSGETSRRVSKTMSTTTKTLPCLMLVWEAQK